MTEVEALVNGWIQEAHPAETRVMPIAEAKAAGAVAMFGEKYGETVRSRGVQPVCNGAADAAGTIMAQSWVLMLTPFVSPGRLDT